VVALFNYMCRVADGLGVDLDTDRGWEDQASSKIAPAPTTTA
jgi:hypothetical protein